MAKAQQIWDSFRNFVAELGTDRDKASAGDYFLRCLSDAQLNTVYRVSWMAKKIVDIPAKDATREWRDWQSTNPDDITAIRNEENRLHLPSKIKQALKLGRLYGGAAIYIGVMNDDASLPLDPAHVDKEGIDFLTVMSKLQLTEGQIENDPLQEGFGKPKYYEINSQSEGAVIIHPSRLVLFMGNDILDPTINSSSAVKWSDSVLLAPYEAVLNADSLASNTASLVYEAKVDVLQIPNMTNQMANASSRAALVSRVQLAAALKGNNGLLAIDKEEEYNQKTFNFAGLPEIGSQALQAVSGAADIPITRFLGQTPSGINSTGESDLKNYYDSIRGMQEQTMTPAMSILDECLIYSALGSRPEEITYNWASLWQMTEGQQSTITKEIVDSIKGIAETGLFSEDALAEAAVSVLMERTVFPEIDLVAVDEDEGDKEFDEPKPEPGPDDGEE